MLRSVPVAIASGSFFCLSLSLMSLCPPPTQAQSADAINPSPIRAITIRGANAIPETEVRQAAQKATMGKSSAEEARLAAVTAVHTLYRQRGYTMAQTLDAEIGDDGTLTLSIAEGVIRHIVIRGNRKTREWTIRHALSVRPGDVFQENRVADDRRRLARLNIFADVRIAPRVPGAEAPSPLSPTPDEKKPDEKPKGEKPATNPESATPVAPDASGVPVAPPPPPSGVSAPAETVVPPPAESAAASDAELGEVDLVVSVRDGETAGIQASVGYADGVGAIGFVDLSENNILGTGQQAQILWQRTVQTTFRPDGSLQSRNARSAFAVSYASPALNRKDIAFGAAVYDNNTVYLPLFAGAQETIRTYEKRRGARARIGYEVLRDVTAYATLRRDQVGYDNIPDSLTPPFSEIAASTGTVGALGATLVAEGRDSLDFPTRGYRASLKYENASSLFGGTLPFHQTEADVRVYTPLRRKTTGKKPVETPVLATRLLGGASSSDTPLQEQFYVGGYELLRGYDLFAFRGQKLLLATAELRFPLGSGLQAVVFTDYGGAWDPAPRQLRGSLGAGVRFATPIGPIRLDAAYGARLQTYISLGQSF